VTVNVSGAESDFFFHIIFLLLVLTLLLLLRWRAWSRRWSTRCTCDWFMPMTWFIGHDSFTCVIWLIHVTWLIHMCNMTNSYAWHGSFICVRRDHTYIL
jgi:hypothetical protein